MTVKEMLTEIFCERFGRKDGEALMAVLTHRATWPTPDEIEARQKANQNAKSDKVS